MENKYFFNELPKAFEELHTYFTKAKDSLILKHFCSTIQYVLS